MIAMTEIEHSGQSVILKRVFNAPCQLVWRTWTEPELIAEWWAPEGMHAPLESITCDLREGGDFSLTMVNDENEYPFAAVFEVVDPTSRLVYVNAREDSDTTFSATFEEIDEDHTEVTFVITSSTQDDELRAGAEAGWISMYEKLAKVLDR